MARAPQPQPAAAGDVLVRIHAAAINFFDALQVMGKYQVQPPFPWVAGTEFSGEVVETYRGERLPNKLGQILTPGARVFGTGQGAFAEYIVVKADSLLPIPAGWSYKEAA